jgi:hypothetical protein
VAYRHLIRARCNQVEVIAPGLEPPFSVDRRFSHSFCAGRPFSLVLGGSRVLVAAPRFAAIRPPFMRGGPQESPASALRERVGLGATCRWRASQRARRPDFRHSDGMPAANRMVRLGAQKANSLAAQRFPPLAMHHRIFRDVSNSGADRISTQGLIEKRHPLSLLNGLRLDRSRSPRRFVPQRLLPWPMRLVHRYRTSAACSPAWSLQ